MSDRGEHERNILATWISLWIKLIASSRTYNRFSCVCYVFVRFQTDWRLNLRRRPSARSGESRIDYLYMNENWHRTQLAAPRNDERQTVPQVNWLEFSQKECKMTRLKISKEKGTRRHISRTDCCFVRHHILIDSYRFHQQFYVFVFSLLQLPQSDLEGLDPNCRRFRLENGESLAEIDEVRYLSHFCLHSKLMANFPQVCCVDENKKTKAFGIIQLTGGSSSAACCTQCNSI